MGLNHVHSDADVGGERSQLGSDPDWDSQHLSQYSLASLVVSYEETAKGRNFASSEKRLKRLTGTVVGNETEVI